MGETLGNCEIDGCTCGHGVCDDGEDTDNCAEDCKCNNNGICEDGETPAACSLDCSCGNYKCEPELGETVSTCYTQQSFEQLNQRAVAVVVDPIQSVKGK